MLKQNQAFYIRFKDVQSSRTYASTRNRGRKDFGTSYYAACYLRGESDREHALATAGMH